MTAFVTVLAGVLLALAGLQIVESIRYVHQLLIWPRRADPDLAAIQ